MNTSASTTREPQDFVFVVGCGHSGTTLMASMLGAHPLVHTVTRETWFFCNPADLAATEVFLRTEAAAAPPGTRILCEKTPSHVHHIGRILATVPRARVIVMMRDGRDVVASLRGRGISFKAACERWNQDTAAALPFIDHDRVCLVRYEDVVADTQATLQRVCDFVGVLYDPAMLRYHETGGHWFGREAVGPDDGQVAVGHEAHRNWQVHQPLFDGRARWRRDFSAEDVVRFNLACAPLMEQVGYYDPLRPDLDDPYPEVPVETVAHGPAGYFPTWNAQLQKATADGPAAASEPIDARLDETHHRAYGRPWCLGRHYANVLLHFGLRRDDRVLDFGCGAGRLGIWLIPYLQPGRYFGIDAHRPSLEAFARYEIPLHALAWRAPRLLHDDACTLSHFGAQFDAITDFYVSWHLPEDLVARFYAIFAAHLAPGGRVFVPHRPRLGPDRLAEAGLVLMHEEVRAAPMLAGTSKPIATSDHWHVLGLRGAAAGL